MKSVDKTPFLNAIATELGNVTTVTRKQVFDIMAKYGLKDPLWLTKNDSVRIGRGLYSLENLNVAKAEKPMPVAKPVIKSQPAPALAMADMSVGVIGASDNINLIPNKATGYVPFGHFADIRSIIKSNRFYPTYVTGLSGNGKTMMIEQICAQEKRELVRANITRETDEDDLIGGFRLIDGKTVWQNGPVVIAMERGAVLLLDEVDLGDAKLMCLQPVLEGKPIYLKKINKVVTPAAGFNIMATANTKGKGSDDGRFIGTNVMNEAFLERFSITFEQEYPSSKTEAKIVANVLAQNGINDNDFVEKLVTWAEVIRKSFYEGAVSDIISTRRLVHIAEAFGIFGQNREKAIRLCLNRFDVDTKTSFMDLYMKLDETIAPKSEEPAVDEKQEVSF